MTWDVVVVVAVVLIVGWPTVGTLLAALWSAYRGAQKRRQEKRAKTLGASFARIHSALIRGEEEHKIARLSDYATRGYRGALRTGRRA